MSTNRTPIHASSPTFPDQEQKPKAGALRQEEDDHKRKAHHDVVPSKLVFAKDSGDLAPSQLGEKSNMYRTVNESPSMSKEQPKSTKPNQAVDGALHTGNDLLPSSSKKIDGTALSVGDINRDVGVSSKEQPKSSDGLKEKPRIENIKLIKQQPPKDEADLSNSEIRPRQTIEDPVMHDKEDHVVSKESPKTINGRREDMSSTVEWGGGNIAPNQRGGQQESSHVKQKAPNDQIDPYSKEEQINNFPGPENSTNKNDDETSNSLQYSSVTNIPVGIPIAENGGDREGVPPPVNLTVFNIQPPTSDEKKNGKIEVDVKVSFCCRCSIL